MNVSMEKYILSILIVVSFATLIFAIPYILDIKISPMILFSSIIMISIYVILSLEIIHRTSIAIFGALILLIASLVMGIIIPKDSLHFVIEIIDFNTIGLLLGMMIIVAVLGETGIFNWVGVKALRLSKGNLWKLMLILCIFTAFTSMFVDNVTIILLMVPVTLSIFKSIHISPLPFILGQTLASNIGGAATLIGDPPNIIIGSAANIDFNSFFINMAPPVVITLLLGVILLKIIFRKELKNTIKIAGKFKTVQEESLIKDKFLLKSSIIVLAGVIFLFVIQGIIGIEVSIIALGGAAVLLLVTRAHVEKVLQEVDWATLIFFAGLFVVVGILEEVGLISLLAKVLIGITGGDPWITFHAVIWMSAIASAFIDNIPFTATMVPIIETLNSNPDIYSVFGSVNTSPLWWALALGADFGGNGTLIGSSAGVVAAGMALKYGHKISFIRWFKIGFPFMIFTVAVGSIVLMLTTLIST
ncbi:MAG TPA: ArsB/NhaD family transporter [Nitrososphaeraceae archaeon]|nr:ArsB/NhaD family transporter [Nitrososphaeraceae archaeon]